MENPISDDTVSASTPADAPPGQQSDSKETDTPKERGPWTFKVRSDFIQGTTHELRKRGRRLSDLSFEARFLYVYLASFVSKNSPDPFPSMKTIQFDTGWSVSTIKKYRRELERAGLLVRKQRKLAGRYSSNLYTLNDPTFDKAQKRPAPSIQNQPTKNQSTESQSSAIKPPKRYQGTGRETSAGLEDRHEVPEPSSRNTPPAADVAAASATDLPSASAGADAPEPPKTPAQKAEHFIKGYMNWAARAKFSASVIPRERKALVEFFSDNERFTARELLAIMLAAWQAPNKTDESGLHYWWHCHNKAKRIKTFIDFLPNIQDEIEWTGSEKRIDMAFRHAEKFFPA